MPEYRLFSFRFCPDHMLWRCSNSALLGLSPSLPLVRIFEKESIFLAPTVQNYSSLNRFVNTDVSFFSGLLLQPLGLCTKMTHHRVNAVTQNQSEALDGLYSLVRYVVPHAVCPISLLSLSMRIKLSIAMVILHGISNFTFINQN